jgi:hypothetical protein
MPPVEITWYDGQNNLPPLPDNFGEAVVAGDIPPPSPARLDTKKPPGKVIYGEGLTFKGGSHGTTLKIIPEAKAKDLAARLPQVPKSPSNHFKPTSCAPARVRKNAAPTSPSLGRSVRR